uniref:Kazal type peptide n=1 Tax=Glossina morsitans morsitans TaxID=37546 RepID=D3TSC8_GLOMM
MKFLFNIICAFLLIIAFAYAKQDNNENCPKICHLDYAPTCGFNGQCYTTFGNACGLKAANCNAKTKFQQVELDECSRPEVRKC